MSGAYCSTVLPHDFQLDQGTGILWASASDVQPFWGAGQQKSLDLTWSHVATEWGPVFCFNVFATLVTADQWGIQSVVTKLLQRKMGFKEHWRVVGERKRERERHIKKNWNGGKIESGTDQQVPTSTTTPHTFLCLSFILYMCLAPQQFSYQEDWIYFFLGDGGTLLMPFLIGYWAALVSFIHCICAATVILIRWIAQTVHF